MNNTSDTTAPLKTSFPRINNTVTTPISLDIGSSLIKDYLDIPKYKATHYLLGIPDYQGANTSLVREACLSTLYTDPSVVEVVKTHQPDFADKFVPCKIDLLLANKEKREVVFSLNDKCFPLEFEKQ